MDRVLVMSSLMNVDDPLSLRAARITATFVLCVVKRTMRSRGVRRSSSLRPTRCERTTSWSATGTSSLRAASSFTRASVFSFRASGMPLMRTVLRLEYCSSSSHVSSSLRTRDCRSWICASFLASAALKFMVSVSTRPRSSCAIASLVAVALVSSEDMAASSASISIGMADCTGREVGWASTAWQL